MKEAVELIRQSKEQLEEALKLLEEGSLESLLQYFQVGCDGKRGHLPTYMTHYDHGIEVRTATLLNEKLSGTGFKIDTEKTHRSGKMAIYFQGKEKGQNHFICDIDLHKRKITISNDFSVNEEREAILTGRSSARIEKLERAKEEMKEWIKKHNTPFYKTVFSQKWKEHWEIYQGADEKIEQVKEEEKRRVQAFKKEQELKKQIDQAIPSLIETLEPLGFEFRGYFNRKVKQILLYWGFDSQESAYEKLKSQMPNGLHINERILAFDRDYIEMHDINSIQINEGISFRSFEVQQDKFENIAKFASEIGVSNVKLERNSYNSDVHHVEFDYKGVTIKFDYSGTVKFEAKKCTTEELVKMKPILYLAGVLRFEEMKQAI